ncbi:MAG: nucleotidyltransferase family protein [Bryobacteraceae bacterium]|nr:nucleotidyltransferase family protein [Bryobacteraceae bacterium]
MNVSAVILAGGASRRMGRPKALLAIGGETFGDRLIATYGTVCRPVVLVLGHDGEMIRAGLRRADEAVVVVNPGPERGQLSSLQVGIRALPAETEAAVFTPVDYPDVRAETVARLVRAVADTPVAIPEFEGRHGHPVAVRRQVLDEILALPVDAQARDVIRRYRSETRFVECGDPGTVNDIDWPADYERLVAGR